MSKIIGIGVGNEFEADAFLPTQVQGLLGWWETDTAGWPNAVVFNGATISQLTDLSGLGHHLVQGTADMQPTWTVGGSAGYAQFNGLANKNKLTASFTFDYPNTIFLCANILTSVASGKTYLSSVTGGSQLYTSSSDGLIKLFNVAAQVTKAYAAGWQVLDLYNNGAASALGINGGSRTVGNSGANNWGGVTVGGITANGNEVAMGFFAMCAFSAAPSEQQRQRIVRYLRRKAILAGIVI